MFCDNCGAQLKDTSAFCNRCGNPLHPVGQTGQPSGDDIVEGRQMEAEGKRKPCRAKIVLACVVAALVLGIVGYLATGHCLRHDWQEATCTVPKTCSKCGKTDGEVLGHNWREATCTEPKTCVVCGETEGEALGHDWQEAACTVPKTCVVCGETEGEALGHDWRDATCTEATTCSACGETEGEALGHYWQEATCTVPRTCTVCGRTEGSALGHSVDSWNICSICGEYAGTGIAYVRRNGVLTYYGKGILGGSGVQITKTYDDGSDVRELVITGNITGIANNYFRRDKQGGQEKNGLMRGERITKVTIEDSVTGKIGDFAFQYRDHIMDLYIGNGITSIGVGAFNMVTNIHDIYIGDSCKKIERGAFAGDSYISSFSVPSGCSFATRGDDSIFLYCVGEQPVTYR